MGLRGPKPKSAKEKKLSGTHRPDRERKAKEREAARAAAIVALEPGEPSCPLWLNAASKAIWRETVPHLMRLKLLSEVDAGVLARYCAAQARWQWATREYQRRPFVKNGKQTFANPAFKIAAQAAVEASREGARLRLDPASRARLSAPDDDDALGKANEKMKAASSDTPADKAEAFFFGPPKLVQPAEPKKETA